VHWGELLVEEAMQQRARTHRPLRDHAELASQRDPNQSQCARRPPPPARRLTPDARTAPIQFPQFLRWKDRADAVGLLYVGHTNLDVRTAAHRLLVAVQQLHSVWYEVTSGFKLPRPSSADPSTIHCAADVLRCCARRAPHATLSR
jgi:hypothetical protein